MQLLVWIFVMRVVMLVSSAVSYFLNGAIANAKYGSANEMNFETPLTSLVWITSIVSIVLTYLISYLHHPQRSGRPTLAVVEAGYHHFLRNTGRRADSGIGEGFHFDRIAPRERSCHIGAGRRSVPRNPVGIRGRQFLRLLARTSMVVLMAIGLLLEHNGPGHSRGHAGSGRLRLRSGRLRLPGHGPGHDRRRFLRAGHRQCSIRLRAVADRSRCRIEAEMKKDFNIDVKFERAKHLLEANDGAGNTFKATAKPVLIGTAVVGATTMIFSIIMALTNGLTTNVDKLSLLHAPFLLGLITGGAMIYWFTGASTQAVTTGAYRAVEFIKANIKLEGVEKASVTDSKKVVEICTKYAQKGMFNIFLAVFFATLAFAFVDPFFFIGYLISIAIFGLYQAIFMANAGGAWDNAKKIVEVEMKQKGTPLHDATVIGDTVGDPFKDTSSVAMNPVIKFTTLFGLLAVELAVKLASDQGTTLTRVLALAFFVVSFIFVYRSFYGMRIESGS